MTCTTELHETFKRSISTWISLPYRGLQSAFDGRETVIELRDCPACGSTLCKPFRRAYTAEEMAARAVQP